MDERSNELRFLLCFDLYDLVGFNSFFFKLYCQAYITFGSYHSHFYIQNDKTLTSLKFELEMSSLREENMQKLHTCRINGHEIFSSQLQTIILSS